MNRRRPAGASAAPSPGAAAGEGAALDLRATFDGLIEGCQVLGFDWTYLYLNPAAERHNRRPNSELLGRRYADCWPGIELTDVYGRIRRCLETRVADRMENEFVYPDGRHGWFELRFAPMPEGVLILSADITDRKQSELHARHVTRILEAIRGVNQLIVRQKDALSLVREASQMLVSTRSYPAAWIGFVRPHDPMLHLAGAGWGEPFEAFRARVETGWRPRCHADATAAQGRVAVIDRASTCRDCPLGDPAVTGQAGVAMLRHEGQDHGMLGICLAPDEGLLDDEVALLDEVAGDLGLALHGIRTERRRLEYAQLFWGSADALALLNRDYVFLDVNPMYARFWNNTPEGMIGRRAQELVGTDFFERIAKPNIDRAFGGATQVAEVAREVPELGRIHAEVTYTPSRAPDGTVTAVAVVIRDVTKRKAAEAKVRESEARLSAIFRHSPVGVVFTRLADGVIVDVNERFARIHGSSVEDLLGRSSVELGLWANPADREEMVRDLGSRGGRVARELDGRRRDGTPIRIRVAVEQIELDGEQYTLGVLEDVTERWRMQQATIERERLLSEMGRGARIGGWTYDPARDEARWTEQVAEIAGHESPVTRGGRFEFDAIDEDSRQRLADGMQGALRRAEPFDLEFELASRGGGHRWIRAIGHPVVADGRVTRVWGSLQDVTDRKRAEQQRARLEEQLRASQKLEAIGTLAGGIAHDFNNLLVVILNYTAFAVEGLADDHPLRRDLLEVHRAGERAAALTRQLLAFSRRQVLQPAALRVNAVVEGLAPMLRRILGEDVEFHLALDPAAGVVMADPGQLEQVLMNLVVNARDAMPDGGTITIATADVDLDSDDARDAIDVRPGPYVELSVTDTGSGMDAATRARVFEPFFTTKAPGRGTGLGLATSYGIVKQSGGYIWVESEVGLGTTMRVQLPREHSARPAGGGSPATTRPGGSETILVVEDEPPLRDLVRRILEDAGYGVQVASGGDEVAAIVARPGQPIDLLLTDVVMPRTGGRKVATELLRVWPGLRVIYMSGYTDEAIAQHGVLEAGTDFVQKPFGASVLLAKVREVLDRA